MLEIDARGVYRYAEEAESLWLSDYLNGEGSPLTWAQLDTLNAIYDAAVAHDGERGAEWERKQTWMLLQYPSYNPEQLYLSLEKAVREQMDCPVSFIEELVQHKISLYNVRKTSALELSAWWAQIDLRLRVREVAAMGDPEPLEEVYGALVRRLRDVLPDCERIEKEYREPLMRGEYSEEEVYGLFVLSRLQECYNSAMFSRIQPALPADAYTYRMLAARALGLGESEEALKYYALAGEYELDSLVRAGDLVAQSEVYLMQGDLGTARERAEAASRLHPEWGEPYIVQARIIAAAAVACGEREFDRQATWWAAMDYLQLALNTDPRVSSEALNLLHEYRAHSPNRDACRREGLLPGDTWPVRCLPGLVTTVRFN